MHVNRCNIFCHTEGKNSVLLTCLDFYLHIEGFLSSWTELLEKNQYTQPNVISAAAVACNSIQNDAQQFALILFNNN